MTVMGRNTYRKTRELKSTLILYYSPFGSMFVESLEHEMAPEQQSEAQNKFATRSGPRTRPGAAPPGSRVQFQSLRRGEEQSTGYRGLQSASNQ